MLRIAIGISATTLALGAVAAPESYTIDSFHSHPHFVVNHIGFMDMTGRFDKMSERSTSTMRPRPARWSW